MSDSDGESSDDNIFSTDEKEKQKNKKLMLNHIVGKKNYEFFKNELKNFKYILTNYINKHIMYLMITDVKNKDGYIIIKPGYTYNIIERIDDLLQSHEIHCFPIRLIEINAEKEERIFHSMLKKTFCNSLYKKNEFPKSNPKSKEFYYGIPNIVDAFDVYSKTIILKHTIPLKIEHEKTVQEHEKTTQEQEKSIQEQEKSIQEKEKTKQKELELEKEIIDKHGFDCFIKYYEIKNKHKNSD